jgi:hypothetical protein
VPDYQCSGRLTAQRANRRCHSRGRADGPRQDVVAPDTAQSLVMNADGAAATSMPGSGIAACPLTGTTASFESSWLALRLESRIRLEWHIAQSGPRQAPGTMGECLSIDPCQRDSYGMDVDGFGRGSTTTSATTCRTSTSAAAAGVHHEHRRHCWH